MLDRDLRFGGKQLAREAGQGVRGDPVQLIPVEIQVAKLTGKGQI